MVALSAIAVLLGLCATLTAKVLLTLIALVTNVCFFGRFSIQPSIPTAERLGPWIIALPALGGIIIGYMARYGSDKIRGHGIPEAMEAILLGSSKVSWKVALL
jgi:H+/Cl- antiporter ClcA